MTRPLLLSLLLATGCSTTRNSRVEIERRPGRIPKECTSFGEVRGSSPFGRQHAEADLRNRAGDLGADVVLLSAESDVMDVVDLRGEAYSCRSAED